MIYRGRELVPGMLGVSRGLIENTEIEFTNPEGHAFPFRIVDVADDKIEIDIRTSTYWVGAEELAKMEPITWHTVSKPEEEEGEEEVPQISGWLKVSTIPEPQKEETTWLRRKYWVSHPKNPPLYETDQPVKPQQVLGPGRDVLEKKHMPWLEEQPTGYGEAFKPSQTPTKNHRRDSLLTFGVQPTGKVIKFQELQVGDEFAFLKETSVVYTVRAVNKELGRTMVAYWAWAGMQTRILPWDLYVDSKVIRIVQNLRAPESKSEEKPQ